MRELHVCQRLCKGHPAIHSSMRSSAPGLQCRLRNRFPRASIMCLSVEDENVFSTPLLNVAQPFSTRYSSPRLSLHHSKHHLLHQSIVLHPAHMCIMCIIYISLLYANSSRPCVSRISLRPPYSYLIGGKSLCNT